VEFEDEEIVIKGYVSPPSLTRSNRREITFFINGRWIQDALLNTALVQAYHTLLMVGRYPMGFLKVTLPPEDIDVNVHPAKAEVRFRQGDRIFGCIQRAVKRALLSSSPIPQVSVSYWRPYSNPTIQRIDSSWLGGHQTESSIRIGQGAAEDAQTEKPSQTVHQPEIERGQLPLLRTIGQIGQVYIVAEGPDGLYLIDQHAAHERILFEKFTEKTIKRRHNPCWNRWFSIVQATGSTFSQWNGNFTEDGVRFRGIWDRHL